MDFGDLLDGRLVVIEAYIKFPVIEVVTSTALDHIPPKLEKILGIFAIPATIKADNGPPFQGAEFQSYLRSSGIQHQNVTASWPQAKGEVEHIMYTLNKNIRICVEWEDVELPIHCFLQAYSNTRHYIMYLNPVTVMFGSTA